MNPRLVALAGYAGAGKDTAGDQLVFQLGFVKFSFSDALYDEVSAAFRIPKTFLYNRLTKDAPTTQLALNECNDGAFVVVGRRVTIGGGYGAPHSPREILQWWGTEYRRQQDPDYWVKRAAEFYRQQIDAGAPGLVNCSCRFRNEADWVHSEGGMVLRVTRPGVNPVNAHVSDKPLPAELVDGEVENGGTPQELFGNLLRAFDAHTEAA